MLKAVAATGAVLSAAEHFAGRLPYSMTIQVPRFYNADPRGFRRPVEEGKFLVTLEEIKQLFPGYTRLNVSGWGRDDGDDEHVQFEIDDVFDRTSEVILQLWRTWLEDRFQQRSIYIKFTGPVHSF